MVPGSHTRELSAFIGLTLIIQYIEYFEAISSMIRIRKLIIDIRNNHYLRLKFTDFISVKYPNTV